MKPDSLRAQFWQYWFISVIISLFTSFFLAFYTNSVVVGLVTYLATSLLSMTIVGYIFMRKMENERD